MSYGSETQVRDCVCNFFGSLWNAAGIGSQGADEALHERTDEAGTRDLHVDLSEFSGSDPLPDNCLEHPRNGAPIFQARAFHLRVDWLKDQAVGKPPAAHRPSCEGSHSV